MAKTINKADWVGTKAQFIALPSIETSKKYYISDLEMFAITNQAMAEALTIYSNLYVEGDLYICMDQGTYDRFCIYQFYKNGWIKALEAFTPQIKAVLEGKQDALPTTTVADKVLKSTSTAGELVWGDAAVETQVDDETITKNSDDELMAIGLNKSGTVITAQQIYDAIKIVRED